MTPPRRWLDDAAAPDGVRDLLRAAGAPDTAARARMWASLSQTTAVSAAPASVGTLQKIAALTAQHKLVAGVATLCIVSAAMTAMSARSRPPLPARATHTALASRAADATSATPSAPRAQEPAPPSPTRASSPVATVITPPVRVASARAHASSSPDVRHRDTPLSAHARREPAARAVAFVGAGGGVSAGVAPCSALSPVAEEMRMLDAMRAAVVTSPERCVALAADHRQRFGDGAFGHERERYAVEALLRLHRGDEARRRAEEFLAAHPTSTVATTMRRLLASRSNQ